MPLYIYDNGGEFALCNKTGKSFDVYLFDDFPDSCPLPDRHLRFMILYHYTAEKNLTLILSRGLLPNKMGIVYLTPDPAKIKGFGSVLLKIDTANLNLKLTAFDNCKEWEVLCWGYIPPQNITLIGGYL